MINIKPRRIFTLNTMFIGDSKVIKSDSKENQDDLFMTWSVMWGNDDINYYDIITTNLIKSSTLVSSCIPVKSEWTLFRWRSPFVFSVYVWILSLSHLFTWFCVYVVPQRSIIVLLDRFFTKLYCSFKYFLYRN